MGLSSVFSTAITGLQGAETTIDVAGNNVANSSTIGFKSSQALFATQFLQTLSLGSAPTANSGGTNPRQIGLGTQVAGITPNFTQGTLQISSSPSDLAIQGQGFFIVQSSTGEQLYTRNGKFQVNSQNELTTLAGGRLIGYGVDDNFQIQSTTLQPLTVPLGSAAVAKATQNVVMQGTLTPSGDVANTAGIIESAVLGDGAFTAPASGAAAALAVVPNVTTTTATASNAGGGLTPGVYRYKVVFGDRPIGSPPDTASRESLEVSVTLAAGDNRVDLAALPTSANYSTRRIYRTDVNGSTFKLLGEIPDQTTTVFADTVADAALTTPLATPEATISGNYSYYVTFADTAGGPPNGVESRPSPVIGPQNVVNGRIQLTNLPTDSSGQWSVRRIYRNLATDDSKFYFVGELPNQTAVPPQTFTDSTADSVIQTRPQIDFDGPRISTNTLLTNVLQRTNSVYSQAFQLGTVTFAGEKGGSLVDDPNSPPALTITATTTVLDLVTFMSDALGIQTAPGPDPQHPIPPDGPTGANPGGSVTANGQLRLVSNNGVKNAVSVGLSALKLTPTGSTVPASVNLNFDTLQEAKGQSAVSDFVVYDSLGIPLNVRVTAVLENVSGTQTTYRWFADSKENDPITGAKIAVGTGLINFDGKGKLVSVTNSAVNIDRENVPSAKPLQFNLDFSQLSGLAKGDDAQGNALPPDLSAKLQDGFPPGKLSSFIIGEDGVIRGVFDNGTQRDLGQIRLARFANERGLSQRGQNLYAAGVNSGLAVQGNPGEQGIGQVIAGAVELSNTDIGQNLIDLITASTMYRGNARVITAAQQLLDELLNLRR